MQVVFFAWNFSGCAPEQLWQFRPCEPCDKAWRSVFTVTIPAEKWDLMNLGLFQDGTSKKKCHFPGKDDDRRCLARSGPLLFCDWVDPNVSLQHNGIQWHYHPARQQQIKTCLAASPGPSGRLSQEAHHPTLLLSTRAHFNCIPPCLLRQTRVVNRQTRVSSMAVGALGSMAVTFHAELISQQPCRTRHSPEWCNVNATGHVYPAAP